MNRLFQKSWYLTAIAVLAFAAASFGQVTMSLTGVGDGVVVDNSNYGFGVYVDPYTATVGGVPNTPVICDDWSDNSYVGTTWTANVSNISSSGLTGSTLLFGNSLGSGPPTQQTLYQEVAYLATLLLENNGNANMQAGISFAIWNLTYPYNSNQESPSPAAFLDSSGNSGAIADYNWAMGQLQTAINTNTLGNADSFEILTPTTPGVAQEFLVETPESSTIVMLGADLLGMLALAFVFRRRILQPIS